MSLIQSIPFPETADLKLHNRFSKVVAIKRKEKDIEDHHAKLLLHVWRIGQLQTEDFKHILPLLYTCRSMLWPA